ncbi:MAG: glycosyltransferase family 39 protein [Bryobacterales bacterium]|nr:glycosyltransferase family 39 protein [Bryobacterales bacterium]
MSIAGWVALALLAAASRILLAPRYLYHFDAANFALAIEEFNPALHQPQPPGYPLFVGMLRLLHAVLLDPQHSLIAAGVVGSGLALLLLKLLGDRMFGSPAGALAVAAMVFHPAFWFGGVTNQVRVWMAVCSVAVALLAWRAMQPGRQMAWFLGACGALGMLAGFRPAIAVQLMPLLGFVWWRTGAGFRQGALGGGVLGVSMLPWILAAAAATGGLPQWLQAMWGYANEQFQDSSLAFGAAPKGAWQMFRQAFVWNLLGVLSWIWMLPLLRGNPFSRLQGTFLAVWFLPVFLFSALIHIGDPDQALGSIPATCVAGGAVLAAGVPRLRLAPVAALVAGLNVLLFFAPPGRLARACSYQAVHRIDLRTRLVLSRIRDVRGTGARCIDYEASVPTWRQVGYYFPSDYVRVGGRESFLLHGNRRLPAGATADCALRVRVTADGNLVELMSTR